MKMRWQVVKVWGILDIGLGNPGAKMTFYEIVKFAG
jgi:hypothetical protein